MIEVRPFIRDQAGAVFLNPALPDCGGISLVPQATQMPVIIPLGSANGPGSVAVSFETPADSLVEALSLIAQYGIDDAETIARTEVQLFDYQHGKRALSNRAIKCEHVFGTAENPFVFDNEYTQSLLLSRQQIVQGYFNNYSTSIPSSIMPQIESTRFKHRCVARDEQLKAAIKQNDFENLQLFPYWLTMENSVNENTKIEPGIVIPAARTVAATFYNRYDLTLFLNTRMATFIPLAEGATGDTDGVVAFQIRRPDDQQPSSNQGVSYSAGVGNAQFPFRMACPFVVAPRESFNVYFTNLITNQAVTTFFSFFGLACDAKSGDPGQWDSRGNYLQDRVMLSVALESN